jgi:hypothetical protein
VFVSPEVLSIEQENSVRGIYQHAGQFTEAVFNFAVAYLGDHPDLEVGFSLGRADLQAFYEGLPEWSADVGRDDFVGAEPFVRFHLEREIAL